MIIFPTNVAAGYIYPPLAEPSINGKRWKLNSQGAWDIYTEPIANASYSTKGILSVKSSQNLLTIEDGVLSFNPNYDGFGMSETDADLKYALKTNFDSHIGNNSIHAPLSDTETLTTKVWSSSKITEFVQNSVPTGNFVTLDTEQIITGAKSFSTNIQGTGAVFSGDVIAYSIEGYNPSVFDNLPWASALDYGVVKIGSGINVVDGVISVDGDSFNLNNYYDKTTSDEKYLWSSDSKIGNWDNAFNWGNHALAGYVHESTTEFVRTSNVDQDVDGLKTFIKRLRSNDDVVAFALGTAEPTIWDNAPWASTTAYGVVKIGAGIDVIDGVISVDVNSFDLNNYYDKTISDGRFAAIIHNHNISDVNLLQAALDSKEPTITPKNSAFNKNFGTIAGTVSEGNHLHSYSSLLNKPTLGTASTRNDSYFVQTGTATQDIAGYKTFLNNVKSNADVVAYAVGIPTGSIWDSAPLASTTEFGVVKIGSGINVINGVISVDGGTISLSNYYDKDTSDGRFAAITHDHNISDVSLLQATLDGKEPWIGTKNSAFNKSFGTTAGTVAEGNHVHRLDQITNPNTSKSFSMGGNTITWNFTNPVGGMKFNMTGGWSGHVLDIIDTGTTIGAVGDHLIHIETSRENILPAHFVNTHASGMAMHVQGKSHFMGVVETTNSVYAGADVIAYSTGTGGGDIWDAAPHASSTQYGVVRLSVTGGLLINASGDLEVDGDSFDLSNYYDRNTSDGKFAVISHVHAAADITSGLFAVSQGGTGAGTALGARTNLGLGTAAVEGIGVESGQIRLNYQNDARFAAISHGDHGLATHAASSTAHPRDTRNQILGSYSIEGHGHIQADVNFNIASNIAGDVNNNSDWAAGVSLSLVSNDNVTYPYGYGTVASFKNNAGRFFQLYGSHTGNKLYYRTIYNDTSDSWVELYHSGNLLNIGTTASSARTALALGTAATEVVQTHSMDTTADRLLTVGAFGLGNINGILSSDLNTINYSGFYKWTTGGVNYPLSGDYGALLHMSYGNNYSIQLGGRINQTGTILYVRRNNNGSWNDWQELYHSGNLRSNTDNDNTYLKLTGGTLTGALNVISGSAGVSLNNSSGNGGFLSVKDINANQTVLIRSYALSGIQAYFTAGNVGIGTSSPSKLLSVYGASNPSILLENDNYSTGGFILKRKNYNEAWKHWAQRNQHYLSFSNDGGSTYTNKITTEGSTGNVLIAGQLLAAGGTLTGDLNINYSGLDSRLSNNALTFNRVGYSYIDQKGVGGSLHFRTSNSTSLDTTALSILADGKVGIGTTSPSSLLDISSPASANGIPSLNVYKYSDNAAPAMVVKHETAMSTRVIADFQNNTSSVMLIRGDGNIGIGTTSPNAMLTVGVNNTHNKEKISLWPTSNASMIGTEAWYITIGPGAGYTSSVGTKFYSKDGELAAQIGFGGSGSPANRQDSYFAGKMGIGTNSPSAKLDVAGNIKASQGLDIGTTDQNHFITMHATSPMLLFDETDLVDQNWGFMCSGGELSMRTAPSDFSSYTKQFAFQRSGDFHAAGDIVAYSSSL